MNKGDLVNEGLSTAAAKAAGAVLNKNLKGVKDWCQKINELPLNILMLNES